MATQNAINTPFPIDVASGGLGTTTLTDNAVLIGSGTGAVSAITVGSTGELLGGISSSDPAFTTSLAGNFTFTSSTAGVNRTLTISNTDNTNSASAATLLLSVGGGSTTGDPSCTHVVSGISNYRVGPDNTVTSPSVDPFIISSNSNALNTFYKTGENVRPLQPAFLATLSATGSNVTGDGTEYTIAANSEVFDVSGDYDTSTYTFTAPVTGKYFFCLEVRVGSLSDTFTSGYARITTSNHVFKGNIADYGDENSAGQLQRGFQTVADMDASDTCTFTLTISGGTKILDITANISVTYVNGFKVA